MDRAGVLSNPAWCANLLRAGGLDPGEQVLVVVDEPLVEQGAQLVAAAADAGGSPRLELWRGSAPVEAGERADLSVFLAQAPKGDEAGERFKLLQAVTGHGGRQLFLGFVDAELLAGELSAPQPDLAPVARGLLAALEGSRAVRVRGAAGTDLLLRIDGRRWSTDALGLEPGGFANFPGGEVHVAPLADGADGVLVVDLTVPYTVEGLVDEPVALRFEAGRVTSIEGGHAARLLRELVERAGRGANVVAELGIGFNPTLTPRGHVMLDEKAAGTGHVAIGRNTGPYGGDNEASIHVDCVFSAPEVDVDGRPLELQ